MLDANMRKFNEITMNTNLQITNKVRYKANFKFKSLEINTVF